MKMRKLTAAALAVGIIASLTLAPELSPLSGGGFFSAGAENFTQNNLIYTQRMYGTQSEAYIIGYNGIEPIVDIPITLGLSGTAPACRVVSIEDGAFMGCETVEQLILPESLKNIGDDAFYDCKRLRSILLRTGRNNEKNDKFMTSEGVLYSVNEFGEIKDLLRYPPAKSGAEFSVPLGVSTISKRAFAGSEILETVELNKDVTVIGDEAFKDCTNLKGVVIPITVRSFGLDAFKNCSPDLTIYCYPNSEAYSYAKSLGITTEFISAPIPERPTAEVAVAPDRSKVNVIISWKSEGSGYKYNVYRSTDRNGSDIRKINYDPLSETKYTDAKALNGKTYYYFVSSVRSYGENITEESALSQSAEVNVELITIHGYTRTYERGDEIKTTAEVELIGSSGTIAKTTSDKVNGYCFYVTQKEPFTLKFTKKETDKDKIGFLEREYIVMFSEGQIEGGVNALLVRYGDANHDGDVDPKDASLILRCVLQPSNNTLDEYTAKAANVLKNGPLTEKDATQILRYSCGMESVLDALSGKAEGEGA